ncbi:MAG: hypothetical protein ACTSPP_03320 [Candidatus Heimdallarchaeaceae archaeon]
MDITGLNIFELASYLAQKQSLITEYKGINYSHAIAITKSVLYFQEPEDLIQVVCLILYYRKIFFFKLLLFLTN